MRLFFISVFAGIVFLNSSVLADELVVWNRIIDNPVAHQLLTRALEVTRDRYGDFTLSMSAQLEQGRAERELERNGGIDIGNFAPSPQREEHLNAVRIPVTRGLLGYRVCLIAKGSQSRFTAVKSLKDLRQKISIGQGASWPDTQILKASGIRVVTSASYTPLFKMLASGRFDCFSRSITEVEGELEKYADLGLELERELLIVYPLPTYFFVNAFKPELAVRIKEGLELLIKSGEFDEIFEQEYRPVFEKTGFSKRRIITLDNPLLSPASKAIVRQSRYWIRNVR